jgi:imidazolonepropionase-like amidohydrolase
MLLQLKLAREMGYQVRSFHHAIEAYKIRDVLAREGVSVSTWADWWGFKIEAWDAVEQSVALIHEAGARAIVHTDSAEGIQRMNQEAAKALASGRALGLALSEDDALRWITVNAAWALGIEGETGTLERGKMADVVVWDAHPLSVYARAEKVFVDGHLRLDRGAPRPAPRSDFEVTR